MKPTFDSDGYPTDETLKIISEWDGNDVHGWVNYIREAWNHRCGRIWEDGGMIKFATGGWSGNESIIQAMTKNILWTMLWESSHRGGLEVLRLSLKWTDPATSPDLKAKP
jgi:hypothetical protein